jgi:hypothetical protein
MIAPWVRNARASKQRHATPEEAAMSQNNTKSNALTVRSAIKAGRSRVDQPDPPNRRQRRSRTRRLAVAQFGVNEHGVPTFTKA